MDSLQRPARKMTSTRALKAFDISVEVFPLKPNTMRTSITFRKMPDASNHPSSKTTSDDNIAASVVEETKSRFSKGTKIMNEEAEVEYHECNPCKKRKQYLPKETRDFLVHFSLKLENIRQTIIRRFKHTMMKVYLHLQSQDSQYHNSYNLFIRSFEQLYLVQKTDRELSAAILQEMNRHIQNFDNQVFKAKFTQKSCNNRYVKELFKSQTIRDLYQLHHFMAIRGRLYFEKFRQFKELKRELTSQEKEKVFLFCQNIAERTSYASP